MVSPPHMCYVESSGIYHRGTIEVLYTWYYSDEEFSPSMAVRRSTRYSVLTVGPTKATAVGFLGRKCNPYLGTVGLLLALWLVGEYLVRVLTV